MTTILKVLSDNAAEDLGDSYPRQIRARVLEEAGAGDALRSMLSEWAAHSPLPICLMLDEVDAPVGDSLISLLRQLGPGTDGAV